MKAVYIGIMSLMTGLAASVWSAPNVVVIMADDQGWGDLSLHGNRTVETPHLDKLAMEGVRFDRFFVQPVCSPTRAEFLTGRYHPRGGVYGTSAGGERLDLDERTIAEAFKAAGYRTGVFGKWHNGSQFPYHPQGRGFDEFYGFTSGHWGLYFNPMVEENGVMTRGNGYLPDDYTDHAIGFLRKAVSADMPFFVFLAYNIPHSPMQVPDRFWEKYADLQPAQSGTIAEKEEPLHTRAALAMCENMDWNVGRLLEELERLAIDRETIVVFLSDNGPNGWRWNGGMKGKKGSTDEGGVRSPLFIRWPACLPEGKLVTEPGAAIDLYPTLADLAGIPLVDGPSLDGVSLKPLLIGDAPEWPDRFLFSYWNDHLSVRTKNFRLDHADRLYDMRVDPLQTTDVGLEEPAVLEDMQAAATQWRATVLEDAFDEARPFLVGYPGFSVTQLPARDARATGSIERSNRYPNDSFFRNWTSINDSICWNVEILESGLYAAEIWYACREEDTGCVVELRFKDASTSTAVHEAHDPPYLGIQYTRSPLYESPVKIFRRMGMGTLRLEKGAGDLVLRTLKMPGEKSIELRLLTLVRIQ